MTDKVAAVFGLNTASLRPLPADSKTREEFEQWASDDGETPLAITRQGKGYMLHTSQLYWVAWQACAALRNAPVGGDVLSRADAKTLAAQMLDGVLVGEMPHEIDIERICCYVVNQS